jgi:hypothetical protein
MPFLDVRFQSASARQPGKQFTMANFPTPDIDLKDSRPSRIMFSGLAVFFAFVVLFTVAGKYSVAEMLIMWFGTLVFVRYGAKTIFHKFSYHRGIWHSILAMVFSAFVTAAAFKHIIGRHDGVAWLAAAFMAAGFLTHLVLDELYSVDVGDVRIKQSFGTAVKFVDMKHWGQTAAMAGATALAFLVTPPTKPFVEGMGSKALWTSLSSRLLPAERDKWFGVDLSHVTAWTRKTATKAASELSVGHPVTTGSIKSPDNGATLPKQ